MQLSIKKDITPSQLKKLIFYSNNDPEILKFTHDSTRFSNLKAFKKWFTRDIKIFVLTDASEDFLGLIWIKPKTNNFSKYKHTFAIRIYKPIRGMGYAYDFASTVFKTLKIDGLWLSVNKENIKAINFYNKLNFRFISNDNDQIIMELCF